MGLNPGGDCYVPPVTSVEEGNAFRVEPNWSPDGKRLQQEVCLMFQRLATALGRPLEWSHLIDECLTANFCPFRSSRWEDLPRKEEALKFSFQLWQEIFENGAVHPRVIISNGSKAVPFLRDLLKKLESKLVAASRRLTLAAGGTDSREGRLGGC